MGISINNIAQQIQKKTGKGTPQEVRQDVRKSYATAVRNYWFENKKNDVGELDGALIIPFTDTPILDTNLNYYYINLQSTYVQLPQECGIVRVCYVSEPDKDFILTNVANVGSLNSIKAGVMGGRQLYYTEGMRMYFPRMTATTNLPVISRFALALDNIDVDASLNISPDLQDIIVQMCIAKYNPPTEVPINEKIK